MKYIIRLIRNLIFWIQDYFSKSMIVDFQKPTKMKVSIFKRINKYARIMQTDWIIYRFEKTDKGTISVNLVNIGDENYNQIGYNIELPYKDNRIEISCIPSGIYSFEKASTPHYGNHIKILNVLNRTHVLVHSGNYMKDTLGCILPNLNYSYTRATQTPYGITSKPCLKQLIKALPDKGTLHIV